MDCHLFLQGYTKDLIYRVTRSDSTLASRLIVRKGVWLIDVRSPKATTYIVYRILTETDWCDTLQILILLHKAPPPTAYISPYSYVKRKQCFAANSTRVGSYLISVGYRGTSGKVVVDHKLQRTCGGRRDETQPGHGRNQSTATRVAHAHGVTAFFLKTTFY